jgi:CheY-like chemotaxis protein
VPGILSSRPRRALVAAGERPFCALLGRVLYTLDVAADPAYSAQDAVRLFARNRYDLALMDSQLYDVQGVSLATMLSRRFGFGRRVWGPAPPRLPPILVFTRSFQPESARQFLLGEGVVGYLKRPLRVEQVLRVVRELLEWQEVRAQRRASEAARMAESIWRNDGLTTPSGKLIATSTTRLDMVAALVRARNVPAP